MRVKEIWRYPVKSMIGERVATAELDPLGVVGDRVWAARDEVRGGIRGAKKIAGLMRLAAGGGTDGPVTITLPDGTTLWPLRPADDLDHYRRGAPDSEDFMEELNAIFGREDGEPLPDLSVFPPEIMEFESPPGTYYDAFPLLLVSTSALRTLADALPESVIDVRRFRPSLVIDTGDEPGYLEFEWVGRRVTIGGVELEVRARCPRCIMVTREIDDAVPVDRKVLRHIVRELGQDLGVYATVTRTGPIHVGDAVSVDS
jgi:uncharacterized protein YcbX